MKACNKRKTVALGGDGRGSNGKAVMASAKRHLVKVLPLLNAGKPERDAIKKKSLDSFLHTCWQLGWLRDFDITQPKYEKMHKALKKVKDAFETDVIWAPGGSPTYGQVEKVRKVYKAVCDAIGKKSEKKSKRQECK